MYQLTNRITIYNVERGDTYNIDFVKSIKVSSSWDMLISTANIVFPKRIYVNKNNSPFRTSWADLNIAKPDTSKTGNSQNPSKKLFSQGDYIKIELGYDLEFNTVFEGFIYNISPKVPIELECVDAMYILNKISISSKFSTNSTLGDVIKVLNDTYNGATKIHNSYPKPELGLYKKLAFQTTIPDSTKLVGYNATQKTIYQVFSDLKKMYSIDTFIQNGTVFSGGPYPADDLRKKAKESSPTNFYKTTAKKIFGFQNNIIESNLISELITDNNVEVIVTGADPDGGAFSEVKQVIAGRTTFIEDKAAEAAAQTSGKNDSAETEAKTKAPEEPILESTNLDSTLQGTINRQIKIDAFTTDMDTLNSIANRKIDKIKYNGYSGSFTTFGKPFIQHGDTIELQDFYIPENTGMYKVKRMDYSFGQNGYRQEIGLHTEV